MGCRSEAYWAARWVFAVCCHRRWSRCRQSTNRTAARIIQTPCWSPQPRCYKLRQTERTEATRRSTWCVPTVCAPPLGLCKDQCGGGGAVSFSAIYWFDWIWITFSVHSKSIGMQYCFASVRHMYGWHGSRALCTATIHPNMQLRNDSDITCINQSNKLHHP